MKQRNIIICSNCYEENTYGENFCYNCGKRLFYNAENTEDEEFEERKENFVKEFDSILEFDDKIVALNKEKQELYILFDNELDKIIKFNSIIECQIIENSNVMDSGGIGRALVGGMIAGGTGAIVGATTRKSKNIVSNLSIRVVTNDIEDSLYNLVIIADSIDTNKILEADFYKQAINFANNVYATIQAIIKDNSKNIKAETNIQEHSSNNGLEQLEKLAELKEKGILTDEEFTEAKQKILEKL